MRASCEGWTRGNKTVRRSIIEAPPAGINRRPRRAWLDLDRGRACPAPLFFRCRLLYTIPSSGWLWFFGADLLSPLTEKSLAQGGGVSRRIGRAAAYAKRLPFSEGGPLTGIENASETARTCSAALWSLSVICFRICPELHRSVECQMDISDHSLYLQRFDFETKFLAGGNVSRNWGPTMRGGFGRMLRRVSCSLGRECCRDCFVVGSCAYGYIFETPVLASSPVMRKYPQAPHPFVFEPPDDNPPFVREADSVWHSLVVIGDAIRYVPHIFLAMEELGKGGLGRDSVPFRIETVRIHEGELVYRHGDRQFRTVASRRLSLQPGASCLARFSIEFQTPARMIVTGRVASTLSLLDIVKALCRRIFLLQHFHCGGSAEHLACAYYTAAEAARCLDQHVSWSDARRYSTRQSRLIPLGGVTGRLTFEGDLGLLRPLLVAGEYVHVGKNATFGLGKMVISEGV